VNEYDCVLQLKFDLSGMEWTDDFKLLVINLLRAVWIIVVVFLQVAGPSGQMTWIRGGPQCLDAKNIAEAIDNR